MIPKCTATLLDHPDRVHDSGRITSVPSVVKAFASGPRYVLYDRSFCITRINRPKKNYPAFFRIFIPIRNNFRTVPVGSCFI
jgi:hypothetical protein